jgi:small-conductance mechanosensitive channel
VDNVPKWQAAGVIQPIDTSRVSYWDDMFPALHTMTGAVVDNDLYMVLTDFGLSSIIYRTDIYEGEETWGMLFDENYAGRICARGTFVNLSIALKMLGYDVFEPSDEELAEAGELARMQRPLVRFYWDSQTDMEQAIASGECVMGYAWLLRLVQGIVLILLVFSLARHFIKNTTVVFILKWIGIPLAFLFAVDWLDEVTRYLDSLEIHLGNIRISLYIVLRTFIFGALLFWLDRLSNKTGQKVIRGHAAFDVTTKEVVAKLFEIGVFLVIFLLLLNVMGINLTALAVFGGALGVGLGFGLQQIASNFISGLIILMDRTITIGDYIELEDGRAGRLRELTMRSATLETFDGKDIMVPNERFITEAFTNWTHYNQKQRYSLNFQVAYKTDLEAMFEIVREIVASHPKVLSGDDLPISERPDAEIQSFDDSGITILVEFWMEGIDDGDNRVGADLLMMIWTALKTNGIEIPFPQREIKIVGEDEKKKKG